MTSKTIYSDKHVTITDDSITFHYYYSFPLSKQKVVKIRNIQSVTVKEPTLRNGKWRLHGTGNFKIWFTQDFRRPKRDRIFFMVLKNQWVNIGFTVEDGQRVEDIFRSMGLMRIG